MRGQLTMDKYKKIIKLLQEAQQVLKADNDRPLAIDKYDYEERFAELASDGMHPDEIKYQLAMEKYGNE